MDNRKDKQTATPLDVLCAQEAQKICEELDYDLRNTADYCHNNNGHRTFEDWEKMDKYLLGVADRIRRLCKLVGVLSCYAKGGNGLNGAKMREALNELIYGWDIFINGLEEDLDGHYPANYQARRSDYEKRIRKAKSALAAPPRNCDVYANGQEAWDEYFKRYITPNPWAFYNWLYAEAKGGAK